MNSIYISPFYKNCNLHTYESNFFFAFYMSQCPTINFRLSILSKRLAKHICTKVPFQITIRNRHGFIYVRWPWIWNQHYYLGIWNYDSTKITYLPSFQLATRLNSQNTNETVFINELCRINLRLNIDISNWHNWTFDLT